ncbi:MAG: DUF1264 domain-containing protein [Nitrosopumilus sp.]|nr:MAG: DUF1264 domain-containing protein [Nitrosopumilus sp.]QMU55418.1 MAG: DUF1264 domain-containing protein [Nitrosopumilus sp.]
MKRNSLMAFALLAVTLSVVTVSITDFQDAEAAKASGTNTPKYGSATKDKVCGDRLCSEIPSEERKQTSSIKSSESGSASSSETTTADIDTLVDRMDSVHQKHMSQMTQMWQTMTSDEQSKMIQKMEQMIGHMETMDMSKYTSEMEGMMKMDGKHHDKKMMKTPSEPRYNEVLNPRQVDYPNTLGFSDLHIHAIRHLDVNQSHGTADHLLQTIVHHHCKVYDDNTAACLLFPYGMTDQDKPYGIEYVITTDQYNELPEEEKQYWHYHKTEFPRALADFPELNAEELAEVGPMLDETYGKVFYFWNYGDTYPIGEPYVLVVQDIPDQ